MLKPPPSLGVQVVWPNAGCANNMVNKSKNKVMPDCDLADLYDVPTKALNQAVSRNIDRFSKDFMFRLSREETEAINRSQAVTSA